MFKIMDDPQVSWPVKVQWPIDGGGFEEQPFTARFRILPDDERARLTAEGDIAGVLRVAVVGWAEIQDERALPVDFTPERLERMLHMPATCTALTMAYGEILRGKAAEGNSGR